MDNLVRRFLKRIKPRRGYKKDIVFRRADTDDEGLIRRKFQADVPVCPGYGGFHKSGRLEIGKDGNLLSRRVDGLEKEKGERLILVNADGILLGITVLNYQFTLYMGITCLKHLTFQAGVHHVA